MVDCEERRGAVFTGFIGRAEISWRGEFVHRVMFFLGGGGGVGRKEK